MDIQELGSWGEFLGGVSGAIAAAGVILTLLYLARQVHQNTEQTRAQMAHNLMASLRSAMEPVTEISIAETYQRGCDGLENLSASERRVFGAINARFHRVFEEAFLHHQAGRLEEAYWLSLSGQYKVALTVTGIRQDWKETRDNFDTAFQQWVNSELIQ